MSSDALTSLVVGAASPASPPLASVGNATHLADALCPLSERSTDPDVVSNTDTVPSSHPAASSLPSPGRNVPQCAMSFIPRE
eukprot:CAMPEP_0198720850 /NCGR_PEP_ID=MMETSP1471-20131121/64489_1 /TAXON_ID=41880 /ORGANISM="Pycnococcus provasolii, Strain RCC733" /LENGTH=81 /DNA_ID=CAMNT_0044481717 /DNA_START=270 /DNA_END=512 /DNA_ORIENTATION=+